MSRNLMLHRCSTSECQGLEAASLKGMNKGEEIEPSLQVKRLFTNHSNVSKSRLNWGEALMISTITRD